MLCRHCNRNKRSRARGLCFACSRRPEVRALYPSTSKYARQYDEPTQEQLDALIAEQMRNLPAWWNSESALVATGARHE